MDDPSGTAVVGVMDALCYGQGHLSPSKRLIIQKILLSQ